MTKKYHCPHHEEKTPSAVAYANSYFSFCCGRSGPLSELGLAPGMRVETTYIEDIESSVARIKSLPKQAIRGFQLHADDRGYYILWPDETYYKRRVEGVDAGNKYRGPSGHKKPPFWATPRGTSQRLIIVEGEFNAMSLALISPFVTIMSPGGAGDFYSTAGKKLLESLAYYERIDLVVDEDAAGAQAAIEAKSKLIVSGCPDVRIHLVAQDFNGTLCKYGLSHLEQGKEALRVEAKRLGLW